MINTRHLLVFSFVLGLLLPLSSAHAGEYKAPRILDGSVDEGARYYRVICPDDKHTSIHIYYEDYLQFKKGDVCYVENGKDKCSKGWSIDDAAVKACKAKKI